MRHWGTTGRGAVLVERFRCDRVKVSNKVRPVQVPSAIHRFLARRGPYQALFILAIPLSAVEPLKLVALFVIGHGHFIAGVVVMICAYAGSLFITERLFVALKPKL